MPDVFISYAKQDYERARMVADALSKKGWSVWWDPTIAPGQTWAQVIEEQIKADKCVVVLWTKTSVSSRWVRKEARFGLNRDILIPALIDEVELPFEFEDVEAARLANWSGEPHPEFTLLTKQVAALAGEPDIQPTAHPSDDLPATAHRHRESGKAYIESGDTQRGISELEQALRGFEATEQWAPAAAVVDVILQLIPDSIAHRQKRVELAARSSDQADLVHAMVELAAALERTGAHERARITYQQVLEQEPQNAQALAALGINQTADETKSSQRDEPQVHRAGPVVDAPDIATERARVESDKPIARTSASSSSASPRQQVAPETSARESADRSGSRKPPKKEQTQGLGAVLNTKTRVVFAAGVLTAAAVTAVVVRNFEFREANVWLQIAIGVFAFVMIRVKHLPHGIWPAFARRDRFSPLWALIPIGLMGMLVLATQDIGRPAVPPFPSALLLLAGLTAWTIAMGRTRQGQSATWYIAATGAALLPILGYASTVRTAVGPFSPTMFLKQIPYWSIPTVFGALITTELVFRRILIGPPAKATLKVVIGSAVISTIWVSLQTFSLGSLLFEVVLTFPAAIIAGCIYSLSGSLLVSALYTGLLAGLRIALNVSFYESSLDQISIYSYSDFLGLSISWPLPLLTVIFALVFAYRMRSLRS